MFKVLERNNRAMRLILTLFVIALGILSLHGAVAAGNVEPGKFVYNKYCSECHDTGKKGAPKLGDKAAWADRIK